MSKLILPFILLLGACGKPSINDFMADEELLSKTYDKCFFLMLQGQEETKECENVRKAAKKILDKVMKNYQK